MAAAGLKAAAAVGQAAGRRMMSSAAGGLVTIERRDTIAIVKMNRAPVNSLNLELLTELKDTILACERV